MQRCKHDKYGLGIVLETSVSQGGKPIARVIFDARPDEERVLLLSVLCESNTSLPPAAKAKSVRKPRKKKTEVELIPDDLLVDLSPKSAVQLDPVDVDELPEELKNEPETADDSEALYG